LKFSQIKSILQWFEVLLALAICPAQGLSQDNAEFGLMLRDGRAAVDADRRF
jgi:hypothetical protein